ncbi:ATP-binding protein [Herbivorax sp. ANBcel31]|uniref:ATP-binding protein n=1 Tax=Herbivorax sp. ANBcel31 TaxID=3069754 RepID=UPI0027B80BBB|nr:ATP-binding protein [Herbivorax sp. ANBcel31]MDQ2087709.1 ATP-binding protein [Herbivorax sp. ANBcel31]
MELLKSFNSLVDNKNTNIRIAIEEILKFLCDKGICTQKDILFEVKVIINELIQNAINHGNKNNVDKVVKLKVKIADEYICIIVEDQGEGYNFKQLMGIVEDNQLDVCDICDLKESGRGIYLVKNLSERMAFNSKGNKVEVIKKVK